MNDWTRWEQQQASKLAREAHRSTNYGQGPTPRWDEVKTEARQAENYRSGQAVDHYSRYREDLALARQIGLNAFRFSIEWSRVEPRRGQYDEAAIRHYAEMAATCHKYGQEPFVTLWHFTLPVWAAEAGGWESAEVVERFVAFAEVMGQGLRPHVRYWATLNEPEVYAGQAYLAGVWPPGYRSPTRFSRARRALMRAHRGAYQKLKSVEPTFQVGFCTNQTVFVASPAVLRPVANWLAHLANDYFPARLAGQADWIGLQYYFRRSVGWSSSLPKSDLGWDLYPEGHAILLRRLARFGKPLFVTESGLADARDRYRSWYIEASLASIKQALADGVDCRGYFHWSLLDNFEWHEGFWPRFGLVRVDHATLERELRPSAYHYGELVQRCRSEQSVTTDHDSVATASFKR